MSSSLLFVFVAVSSIFQGYCPAADNNSTVEEYCLKETNVTQKLVDSYEQDPDKEPTEDYYCYTLCVLTTLGAIEEDGTIQVEEFKEFFPDVDEECLRKAPKIVECNDIEALDDCDI